MPVCEACSQEGATKCCSRCMEAWYCSAVCQKQQWKKGHKHKCVKAEKPSTAAAMASATPLPAAARSAAQRNGDVSAMSLRELKQLLDAHGVDYSKCIEKSEICALATDATADDEECAICLDVLQQPQTMPCGHRFCRGCVACMRQHGVGEAQVCPLCRGPMPDAERLFLGTALMLMQYDRLTKGEQKGAPLSPSAQELLSKATGQIREVLAIDPEHARAHTSLGVALECRGDLAGAKSAYRAATTADPQDAKPHFTLGNVLEARGNLAGAEAAFRTAITLEPQLAMAHGNLGNILMERGDWAGAEAYRAALAADPQLATAHRALDFLLTARGNAEAVGRAAITADPQDAMAHTKLGNFLMNCGDVAGAEAAYRAAIAADPQDAKAHSFLGGILGERGDTAGAGAMFCAAIAADPQNTDAHCGLGLNLMVRGDVAGAVIAADPQYAYAHCNLGALLMSRAEFAGAAASFAKTLQINPSHESAMQNLAMALKMLKMMRS